MSNDFYSLEEKKDSNGEINSSILGDQFIQKLREGESKRVEMEEDSNKNSSSENQKGIEAVGSVQNDGNNVNKSEGSNNSGGNSINSTLRGASGFFSRIFYRATSKDKDKDILKKEEKSEGKKEETKKEEERDSRFKFMDKKTKSMGTGLIGSKSPPSPETRKRSGSVSSPSSSPMINRKSVEPKGEKKENALKNSGKISKETANRKSIEKEEKKQDFSSASHNDPGTISPRKKFTQRSETAAVLVSSGSSKSSAFKISTGVSASDPSLGENANASEGKLQKEKEPVTNQKYGLRRIMSDDTNLRTSKSSMGPIEDNDSQLLLAFKNASVWKRLELVEMELFQIPEETFNMVILLELNLAKNKLTSISPSIKNLINLKSLNVSSNQLTSLPCEIGNLKNLTDLKISFNPLPVDIRLAHWRGNLKELLLKQYQLKKKEMLNPSPGPSKLSEWTRPKQQPLHLLSVSAFSFTTKTDKTKVSKTITDKLKVWDKQLPLVSFGDELTVSKRNEAEEKASNNNEDTTNTLSFSSTSITESSESTRITNNNVNTNSGQKDTVYQGGNYRGNSSSRNLANGTSRRNLNESNAAPSLLRSPLRVLRLLGSTQNGVNNSNLNSSFGSDNSDSDSLGSSSDEAFSTDNSIRSAVNAAYEWKEENNEKIISKNHDVEIIGVTEIPLVGRGIGVGKFEKATWLEQLIAISEYSHENVNGVVAVLKFNRKKTKFRLTEPYWVNQLLTQPNEEPFLVLTEKCSGNNLKDWNSSQSGQTFLLKKRMQMIQQVASGMQFLHEKQIIHHNLKLSNVISSEKGMRVTDYFLGNRMLKDFTEELIQINESKRLSLSNPSTPSSDGNPPSSASSLQSSLNTTVNLPYWMAPEILENEEYDEKIDIYSFGMLIYELLTGKTPFEHLKTIDELIQAVCIQNERPSLKGEKIPKNISNLIERCTKKEPSERPSFAEILENFYIYLVESVCDDERAALFWWTEFKGEESVEWKVFTSHFFSHFKVSAEISKNIVLIDALRGVLVDSDEVVTMENFSKMSQWFGPMDGTGILQRMIVLHSQPWFYGNLSSIQAEDALADKGRGTFLIRFSSSNPGSFAISVNSEEGPVKHYKIWHRAGQGYSLGKEEFVSFESLIASRRDLLYLRVPCAKGDKYSDSNFWATQESVEGGELKTVVSLKKLCFRHIYREAHLYQNLENILPSDLIEEYRCAIIDAATTDETGRSIWKDCWLLQDSVSFEQFASALCVFLSTTLTQGTQNYNCLKAIIRDINDSKSDIVSTETFSKLLEWFGPLDSTFLDKISHIVTKPWFHGNMSHQQAEKLVQKHNAKKGTFLIRFSSKSRGYFTITVLGRNRSLLHYRVYYNRQEIKYVIGKRSFNSLDDIIRDYYRELYLKNPCPGSKFTSLQFDPFQMEQRSLQNEQERG